MAITKRDVVLLLEKIMDRGAPVQANGGMAAVADKAHLNRESLYRTLSRRGNPEIRTLFNLLHGVGLRLNITPERVSA
ncbi:hypothetical protein GPEL0_01r3999 [Geoanaerobacter pelophilus]|uniref:Addiction module antidote protein n=1 Tax=Geoanaerobacter pelophilus TaxID=60036 RepID=A0ABQ0MLE4_9BACT|nr:hypothetical protein [Geoanaerobacter pelophilus]GAW67907.1 hypothetical protein GPEL0_01r3999 [Geoanaerobacter pelophilus]